jgi:hypothetical protein
MKPDWRTDASLPVDLSDEETTTVEIYCQWLYFRKIVSKEDMTFSKSTRLPCSTLPFRRFSLGYDLSEQHLGRYDPLRYVLEQR